MCHYVYKPKIIDSELTQGNILEERLVEVISKWFHNYKKKLKTNFLRYVTYLWRVFTGFTGDSRYVKRCFLARPRDRAGSGATRRLLVQSLAPPSQ